MAPSPPTPDGLEPLGHPVVLLPRGLYYPLAFWMCALGAGALLVFTGLLALGVIGPRVRDANFVEFMTVWTLAALPGFLLLFGGLGAFAWFQMRKRIWLGPNGFAWVTPSRRELFLWGQIKTVTFPVKVKREDGFAVNLSNHVDSVRASIPFEASWVPIKLAELREKLGRGTSAKFGPLEVSSYGVHKSGELLPWGEIEKIIRIQGRMEAVALKQKGRTLPWCLVGLADVPNYLVFERLVVEMTAEVRG